MKKIIIVLFTIVLASNFITANLKLESYWEGSLEVKDASSLGFKDHALGINTKFSLFLKRIGFYFSSLYSQAQKRSATKGYVLNAQVGAMYCLGWKKLFLVSGIDYRSYTGDRWEKKSHSGFVGLKYGLPRDLMSIFLSYYFKEKQTNNQCEYLSADITIRLWRSARVTIFARSSVNVTWFYQALNGKILRMNGATEDLALGVLYRL